MGDEILQWPADAPAVVNSLKVTTGEGITAVGPGGRG
jgi:hypothetical protein